MSETNTILLVDDEPGVRESVQAYLEYEDNIEVKVAASAKEAYQILETLTPDLIISDLMMPEIDGYEFLKTIREDVRFQNLPVIFLTARGMTDDRIQGYNVGCDAYLSKPFEPDELEAIVKNLLAKNQMRKESMGSNPQLEEMARDLKEIKDKIGGKSGFTTTPPPMPIDLTPREQNVLDLVAQGLMNKEIAKILQTSVRNVEKYVSRLFSKTDTNSRTELVRFALKHGLTE